MNLLGLPAPTRFDTVNAVVEVPAGGKVTLLDLEGPGCITRIWMVPIPGEWRDVILRAYWDDEASPSIESPLGDFFGLGHGLCGVPLNSEHVVIAPKHGLNMYFDMPFARGARLELASEGPTGIGWVYFLADCLFFDQPPETPYRFHAKWRREAPALRRATPYTILEARGKGYIAGVTYHVHKVDDDHRWTHGGGGIYFIDGESAPNFVHMAGGEDFFGGSWGAVEYQSPYLGVHYTDPKPTLMENKRGWTQPEGGRWSLYRWFDHDPVVFNSSIRFAFGANANHITSVAYWYQTEPHVEFFRLPPSELRREGSEIPWGEYDLAIRSPDEIPIAILGPVVPGDGCPWVPEEGLNLQAVYQTNCRGPYQTVVEGDDRPIRWQRTETRMHFLDWNAIHRPKVRMRHLWPDKPNPQHTSGLDYPSGSYALARAYVESKTRGILHVGSDNRIQVWHNGKAIFANERPMPMRFGEDAVPVSLQPGANDLVVFNTTERRSEWGGWAISLRLTDPGVGPLPGLRWEEWKDLPHTPERQRF
jgi:hypothetical protein